MWGLPTGVWFALGFLLGIVLYVSFSLLSVFWEALREGDKQKDKD